MKISRELGRQTGRGKDRRGSVAREESEVHPVMMQVRDGQQMHALLECLAVFGVTRVVFPTRGYRSARAGDGGQRDVQESLYDTARLLPRGDDGGFAEKWFEVREGSRHMGDT